MRIITTLFILFYVNFAVAGEVTAANLQKRCSELQKASVGQNFSESAIEFCRAYMAGFFDSMIVAERLSGKPQLCIPKTVPTVNNTEILDKWIAENTEMSEKTTAAVALYAAYKKAFACE